MTVTEAAAVLGLKPDTVRQQCQSGKLRATKRGRDWWISPAAARDYEHLSLSKKESKR